MGWDEHQPIRMSMPDKQFYDDDRVIAREKAAMDEKRDEISLFLWHLQEITKDATSLEKLNDMALMLRHVLDAHR
jgi:hypothetical protein